MYLRRLELTGFKSFADRTQLDLSEGLNAVVGPNGSGKSNIADALRWVLGEQSAKQLRGGKMEDVIFSGTAHRRPLGYAEIVMRIDNSDGKLPLEFPEITIARRVYRSGESEYSINGEQCRLKDIQMLFMDTGVGRDGYSIIGQGRIDEILSLRSEDRRLVFEEAAGIGKFKTRRNEAMSKLEKEKQNRERVDDIILDLEEQLVPLEGQAEEAKRYLTLRDEYKSVHISISLEEIAKIDSELAHIEETLKHGTEQFQDGARLLGEARLAGEGLKSRAAKSDLEYRRATEVLLEVTTALEKSEGDNKLLESKLGQLTAEQARLKSEVEKREAALQSKSAERQKEEEAKNAAQAKLDELNNELDQHLKLSAQMEDLMRESSAELEAHNQAIMDALTVSANSRASVTEAENAYLRLEDEKEQLDNEIMHHDTKIEEHKQAEQEAKEALQQCQSNLNRIKASVEAYTSAYRQLVEENQALDQELRRVQEAFTVARGRHRVISELEAQQEGFYQSVKTVLRKKATDPNYSGICGAISELIGVEQKYEIAIETALGGAAQNIVTKQESDAKLAINMLKETRGGRATFMPLTAAKGRTMDVAKFANEPGFIGLSSGLVTYDEEYAQVIAQLLGDVLVMDTMDNAMAFNKKYKYSHKIVTLDGERLSPGGAITGGGTNRQSAGIIGRARQLEELKQKVAELQTNLEELTEQKQDLRSKRQATEETLIAAREKEQALILETERQKDRLAAAEESLKNLDEIAAKYNEENDKIMGLLVETNSAIRNAKAEVLANDENVQKAREALENYQRQLEQSRLEHTEETDILTDLKIEISRRTEWIGEARRNLERLQREEAVLTEERRMLLADISVSERAAEKAAANRAKIIEESAKLKTRLGEIRRELSAAEEEKTRLDAAITKAEEDERAHADSSALIERELARLEMRKEQLDATSHRLHGEMWEEYNLTYQKALAQKRTDVSETALRRMLQQLRSELAALSNVNIGAIDAYKQIKTRCDFLTAQRNDILEAETALTELIGQLTSQMEEQFATQFKLIGVHFEEVFRQMFSGGKASLRLLDEENVLESGIEIIAQPPGKALQNLMLLSGGERALTAIALLFAILRLKPSPFCVLDEIESALDDSNVARFASYLKEYAKGTQFIIITHRKGTMEAAEHLYGVTMEEQGISKLVSVRFED
ncbi:MAG: chromosome segregation protein SMC [Firmicutes bacterium]|nr:chromosome segregation protein SMC [Bacillota bacterium]